MSDKTKEAVPSTASLSMRGKGSPFEGLGLFFRLEFAAHLQQVGGVGHDILRFLYHGQVYHAYLDAACVALDALQFLALQVGELSVQVVGLADIFFHAVVIVAFDALAAYLQQVGDVFRHVGKFALLDGVQRHEVVVHVLQTGLAHASHAVNQFAGKVIALVVVQAFLQYRVVVQMAHGYRSGAFHLFDELFLKLHGSHGAAQATQVLVQERGRRAFEVLFREGQYLGQLFAGMDLQQSQHFAVVRAGQQLFQCFVAFFFLLAFLVHHLASDEHEYGQSDEQDDGCRAAVIDDEGHEEADGECGSRRDEPASDDAQYAGDAEYGGVASPGTVGQRGTHGHHERDVCSRKRQFQRSTQGDEQAGQHEVDGSAYQVEGGSVGYDGFVFAEAAVNPALGAFGNNLGDAVGHCQAEADQRTGDGGASEVFLPFVLSGEVDRSFDDVMRLF